MERTAIRGVFIAAVLDNVENHDPYADLLGRRCCAWQRIGEENAPNALALAAAVDRDHREVHGRDEPVTGCALRQVVREVANLKRMSVQGVVAKNAWVTAVGGDPHPCEVPPVVLPGRFLEKIIEPGGPAGERFAIVPAGIQWLDE